MEYGYVVERSVDVIHSCKRRIQLQVAEKYCLMLIQQYGKMNRELEHLEELILNIKHLKRWLKQLIKEQIVRIDK